MAGTAEAPRRLRGWMLLIVAIIAEQAMLDPSEISVEATPADLGIA